MPAETQEGFPITVSDWRLQQLRQAGWPETDALLLAERPEIDLHVACELLERGCDIGTAWRILR
jgi:hypothetical protein